MSPALHQAAYRAAGLDGWAYQARPTRPEELAAALDEVRSGALAGVNLTTPHKQPAAELVDVLERPADRLGAVNTVFVREGRLVGGNTDVAGAVWALGSQLALRDDRWAGDGPAVLLGTGGVALAVAFAWSRLATARRHQGLPVAPLQVAGRDGAHAAAVAGLAGTGAHAVDWAEAAELVAAADVLVQATTLTARGEPVPGQDRLRSGSACSTATTARPARAWSPRPARPGRRPPPTASACSAPRPPERWSRSPGSAPTWTPWPPPSASPAGPSLI